MKFIHIRNRAYDRYVREDNEVCLEQRMVRINGRFCWRWCVYADCSLPPASGSFAVAVAGTPIILFRSICKEVRMEINITYKSPEHEATFLSELQRIPHIVNPESGRINPYWGASLYLLSALTRWPELRIAVIGEDYMMFTAAKEAFNLSQNERIIVELAAAFYNASLWEMPGFEMVSGTCDTAFALILEAFRLRRAKLFCKDGEVSAEWEERK